jgi:alpha-tubulin suppressor-like RCC1 family protein
VTKVAAGRYHSLALKADGSVYAWGYNGNGELGLGDLNDRSTPTLVSGLSGMTKVAAGRYHSLALASDGTVYAWGFNGDGELGDGGTATHTSPEHHCRRGDAGRRGVA